MGGCVRLSLEQGHTSPQKPAVTIAVTKVSPTGL